MKLRTIDDCMRTGQAEHAASLTRVGAAGRVHLLQWVVMAKLRRSRWSRIAAILAIALHVSLPLLAQAAQTSAGWSVSLCGKDDGVYTLDLSPGQSPVPAGGAAQHQHCGICAFNGAGFALPPSARGAEPHAAQRSFDLPRAASQAPAHAASHPPARPRAPPSFS